MPNEKTETEKIYDPDWINQPVIYASTKLQFDSQLVKLMHSGKARWVNGSVIEIGTESK